MKTACGRTFTMSLFLILVGFQVTAQEDKGLEIAQAMAAAEDGYSDYSVTMTMILISSSGNETVRELRVKTREIEGDDDQSLAVFDSPADVKGTGFLSHTHIGRDDEQWLYLPALKRVKRISPANKTSPFMGSEFSYEDLATVPCPVCHMEVDTKKAIHTLTYQKQRYYFCSRRCYERFQETPGAYLQV